MYVGYAPLEQSEGRSASGARDGDRMTVIGGSGFRLASARLSSWVLHDLKTAGAMLKQWPARHRKAGPSDAGKPYSGADEVSPNANCCWASLPRASRSTPMSALSATAGRAGVKLDCASGLLDLREEVVS